MNGSGFFATKGVLKTTIGIGLSSGVAQPNITGHLPPPTATVRAYLEAQEMSGKKGESLFTNSM
jgi:hypothetical protein